MTIHNQWMSEQDDRDIVSVIMPAFNNAGSIRDSLDSIYMQTYRPIELIIVDDGSSDNTREIIKDWKESHQNDTQLKVRYLYQNNKGGAVARNLGLIESKGRYIQFLDADDIISTRKISIQVSMLRGIDAKIAAYGPWRYFNYINHHLKIYRPYYEERGADQLQKWIGGWFVPIHSLLWNRMSLINTGPWDENLAADQDGEYAMRFLFSGGKFIYCQNAWVYYRQNPTYGQFGESVSRKTNSRSIRSRIRLTYRLEQLLTKDHKIDDSYREALSIRYYNIAKNWAMENKILRKICLQNFKRLSSKGKVPGTLRHIILTKLFGFLLTQRLRYIIRYQMGLPTYLSLGEVSTIVELCRFDEKQ